MRLHVIWASPDDGGIGLNGKLPWRIKQDLLEFKRITTTTTTAISNCGENDTNGANGSPTSRNAVIMGRSTWESQISRIAMHVHPGNILTFAASYGDTRRIHSNSQYFGAVLCGKLICDRRTYADSARGCVQRGEHTLRRFDLCAGKKHGHRQRH